MEKQKGKLSQREKTANERARFDFSSGSFIFRQILLMAVIVLSVLCWPRELLCAKENVIILCRFICEFSKPAGFSDTERERERERKRGTDVSFRNWIPNSVSTF